MKMHSVVVTLLALSSSAFAHASVLPKACKNLVLMEAQLLQTDFYSSYEGDDSYIPSKLTLKAKNGLTVGKVRGISCQKHPSLCTNPASGGESGLDWAQVEVLNGSNVAAEVIVSMGGRGGCKISSARVPVAN